MYVCMYVCFPTRILYQVKADRDEWGISVFLCFWSYGLVAKLVEFKHQKWGDVTNESLIECDNWIGFVGKI